MKVEYRGRLVPWITRWSSEVIEASKIDLTACPTVDGGYRIMLVGETPDDYLDDVLWVPERDCQGVGIPMWRDVHSHRQRRCHVESLCQVCGEPTGKTAFFIIPAPMFIHKTRLGMATDVAPTCAGCVSVAREQCPTLKKADGSLTVYEASYWRPHAVFGDIVSTDAARRHVTLKQGDALITNNVAISRIMARQLVVELIDFRRSRL